MSALPAAEYGESIMNLIKMLWKNTHARVWFLVTVIVMVIVFTVSMIATQNPFLRGTLSILWGGERAIVSGSNEIYVSDYEDKATTLAAANAFNESIAEEGITLLKNDNDTLPLAKGASISVFGKNSVNLVYGGSGSGSGNAGDTRKTLYESLSEAEFSVNQTLKGFYENNSQSGTGRPKSPAIGDIIAGFETGETPVSSYSSVTSSYAQYSDAALIVLSRIGGEGFDLPRTMKTSYESSASKISGARSETDHYLELDQNERDLIKHVCDNFSKVIIVINSNNTMELGFLDDPAYWTDVLGAPDQSSKIQAALWIGTPGGYGIMALGRVLNGDVNPSGHTVDTYVRDFTTDPTYNNFGNNSVDSGNAYLENGGLPSLVNRHYFVDYEEGIYIGYRYYETRGYTERTTLDGDANWYAKNLIYPMGHGLSYTEFDWEIDKTQLVSEDEDGVKTYSELPENLTAANINDSISVSVIVTNKSSSPMSGKDVVQLYVHAPYYNNGIEKPHVMLADFDKTETIKPGDTDTVTLTFSLYDIASYDYSDANKNGFSGYELEGGEYAMYISSNSHSWADADTLKISFNVPETVSGAGSGRTGYQYSIDPVTKKDVVNRYDDADDQLGSVLSRSNWSGTFPVSRTDDERNVTSTFIKSLSYSQDDNGKPWQTDDMPGQSKKELSSGEISVTLQDVVGKDYDDLLWDGLLNQLTLSQMSELIGYGAYGTIAIESILKPLTREPDGPSGFTNFMGDPSVYDTCFYASECVIGATWSKEIARDMGIMIGNESLAGYEKGDTLPYSGWYAPAINMHRSQFAGRNWEYYSEDPALSGIMAAEVCLGASSKGVYTFVKHFAINDLETSRDSNGILVWVNEQCIREIYLRPFEKTVKEGKTTAIMSSFNRIGTVWAGGDYRLLTEILRTEWGFNGMVVTDYALSEYMNIEQMIRAGGDLYLNQGQRFPSTNSADATQVTAMRNATKNILYTIANSNAMNAQIDGYRKPVWVIAIIWINIGLLACFTVWGVFAIRSACKKSKEDQSR